MGEAAAESAYFVVYENRSRRVADFLLLHKK